MTAQQPVPITLFATPKVFRGHFDLIQRNAIASWTKLSPKVNVLLMGDDAGTAEVAREFGIPHIGGIASYPSGAPRLDELFSKAEDAVSAGMLCYVNADIMLTDSLVRAAQRVAAISPVMLVGQRWDIDITEPFDFTGGWQERLKALALQHGKPCGPAAIDYFLFNRGLGRNLLPLAVGRTRWDHYLIAEARRRGAKLFDATKIVLAVHQNHDYSHHKGGAKGVWQGDEAKENRRLIGRSWRMQTMDDIAHRLTENGVERNYLPIWRRISYAWRHPAAIAQALVRARP